MWRIRFLKVREEFRVFDRVFGGGYVAPGLYRNRTRYIRAGDFVSHMLNSWLHITSL
jgi:hypothetical protein